MFIASFKIIIWKFFVFIKRFVKNQSEHNISGLARLLVRPRMSALLHVIRRHHRLALDTCKVLHIFWKQNSI